MFFREWKGGKHSCFCVKAKSDSEFSKLMCVSFLKVENMEDFPKVLFSEKGCVFRNGKVETAEDSVEIQTLTLKNHF